MSLCDRCYAPGQCCRALHLSEGEESTTAWVDEPLVMQDTTLDAEPMRVPLPFVPLIELARWASEPDGGRQYADYLWRCLKLDRRGRCGDYDHRPALCRSFEPLADGLCVHTGGAESGDASAGVFV